jgi:hypothetical protein
VPFGAATGGDGASFAHALEENNDAEMANAAANIGNRIDFMAETP